MITLFAMKLLRLLLCLVSITSATLLAQNEQPSAPPATPGIKRLPPPPKPDYEPALTKFDLDFPGGTPGQLAAAIQQAMKHSLNVVVPTEYADTKLPPLKMSGVDVAQLFQAIGQASQAQQAVVTRGNVNYFNVAYGFRSTTREGYETDNTVWYFYRMGAPLSSLSLTRFYLLTPYIDGGLTVDDITTAIRTSWKLRGDTTTPTLSFHQETKLLIAVGDSSGLDIIDSVLSALDPVKKKPTASSARPTSEAPKKE